MRIAHISNAVTKAAAWFRLYKALEQKNIDGDFYTLNPSLVKDVVYPKKQKFLKGKYRIIKRKFFNFRHPRKKGNLPFSDFLFAPSLNELYNIEADIIHLNWIADRFVSLSSLKDVGIPIVWTLHDVWPITGGCNKNLGCEKWKSGCDYCEQVQSPVTSILWKKKAKAISQIDNLTIVTPSKWLGELVRESPFYKDRRIEVIPNCLDTDLFKPIDRRAFRELLSVPINKKVIVFGAVNAINVYYKGYDLLIEALQVLKSNGNNDFHLLVFGAEKEQSDAYKLPFEATFLGNLADEMSLVSAYNCADVFVGPSRQDNLPGTFIEAAACGIPAVGFEIGGIPEICTHKKTGYLARPFEVEDLAYGITWVLEDENRWKTLSVNARNKAVKDYNMDHVADKYTSLYNSVLSQ